MRFDPVSRAGRVAAAWAAVGALVAWLGGCLDSTAPRSMVELVAVSPFTATIAVGDTLRLTATPRDAAGFGLRNRVVAWESGAPEVATVSPSGLVTGMADGLAIVTATSEERRGSAIITVGTPPQPRVGLTVSDPGQPWEGATTRGAYDALLAASSADDSITFVSLTPTTAPAAQVATIQNLQNGMSLTIPVSDGGFDPVSMVAGPGDTLLIVARDGAGGIVLETQTVVAAIRRPIVVRTNPPPRKRDVPLNAALVIVFSEPMDAATLTTSSILLLQGSTPVVGTVRLLDAAGLEAVFEPAGPLAPNTDYQLVVTSGVRDVGGDALEAPVASEFTTGDAVLGGAASLTVSPTSVEGFFPLTTLIRAYVRDLDGNVLVGSTVQWASTDSSVATVVPTGGPASETSGREARLTLLAGGVATITATSEGLSDTAVVRSYPFPPGSVRVTAVTTGEDLDANGYGVDLRGNGQYVPANGAYTFAGVPPSEYPIELTDVASNCVVSGPNPQTVTVVSFDTAQVAFAVTCSSGLPSLRVTIATTGIAIDTDGYEQHVLGWAFGQVAANGSVTYSGITPGERSVELRDVASNCTVGELNPQPVTIVRGATAEVAFTVTCVGGSVRVTAATSGVELDPDGYVAAIPDASQPVPINGSVTHTGLVPGALPVELADVAGNCAVSGANPRTVTVTAGATTDVAFDVTCTAGSASIRVTTATTGLGLDPDGYAVSVDGGPGQPVAASGAVTIAGLPAGDHTVALTGAAANCAIAGNNPRAVSVAASATADVPFAVACTAPLVAVAAGDYHTCGVLSGGAGYCWGNNYYGQSGDGTNKSSRLAPVPVAGGLTFASLALGYNHSCGLTPAGAAYCWGENVAGELGDASRVDRSAPVAVSGGLTFASLDAALHATCGLTAAGAVYCWGQDGASSPTAPFGGPTFAALSVGANGWCGLTAVGEAYCTTGSLYGAPLAVSGGLTFATITVGWAYQCGVTPTGEAYCWGRNDVGQLGSPPALEGCEAAGWTVPCAVSPIAVMGGLTFSSVTAGSSHTCGLTPAGAAYCWGNNTYGQLGTGSYVGGPGPTAVVGGLAFSQLSASALHTCGLATDGAVYCWGYNYLGALGDGTGVDSATPVKVAGQP